MSFKKLLFTLLLAPLLLACPKNPPEDSILVFHKTEDYVHESIGVGLAMIDYLGSRHDFNVFISEDASQFTSENLKNFEAVVFLNTTGDVLNSEQQKAFEQFIQNGGGFVGIHSAADTEYNWPWYGKLVGAYFESHPKQQKASIHIKDTTHLSTKHFPVTWEHFEEYYNYKNIDPYIKVLAQLDETTYEGGTNGSFHPFSWYREFDGGKMFYTGLGHRIDTYSHDFFVEHILGGIEYVLGR